MPGLDPGIHPITLPIVATVTEWIAGPGNDDKFATWRLSRA
jgi:hypothetical protein